MFGYLEKLFRNTFLYYIAVDSKRQLYQRSNTLEFHIVHHCNLNCAGCCHFAPLANAEWFLSPEECEDEMSILSSTIPNAFSKIKILGGEPLLHPEVTKFFSITRRYFPKAEIQLATNGILLDKMNDSFFEACKRYRIRVGVSTYPIEKDYKALMTFLKKKEVDAFYFSEHSKNQFSYQQLESTKKLKWYIRYSYCQATIHMLDHRLFCCHTTAYISLLNNYFGTKYPQYKTDYIDINESLTYDKFLKFVRSRKTMCCYCNRWIPIIWHRTKHEKEEWLKDD